MSDAADNTNAQNILARLDYFKHDTHPILNIYFKALLNGRTPFGVAPP